MKRQKWGIVALVATLLTAGCGSNIELTEKQNAEAAEYAAGVLLKYSKNYDRSIIYPTPVAVSTKEPEATEVSKTKEPVSTTPTNGKTQGNKTEKASGSSVAFEKILGLDGVKLSYTGKKECAEYKEKGNKSYAVYANPGKKLVVVSFQIANNTGKGKRVNLMSKKMSYQLVTSDGKSYEAQKTFFSEDLNFLSTRIKSGEKKKGLLVFMLPKKATVANSQLQISNGSNSATKTVG